MGFPYDLLLLIFRNCATETNIPLASKRFRHIWLNALPEEEKKHRHMMGRIIEIYQWAHDVKRKSEAIEKFIELVGEYPNNFFVQIGLETLLNLHYGYFSMQFGDDKEDRKTYDRYYDRLAFDNYYIDIIKNKNDERDCGKSKILKIKGTGKIYGDIVYFYWVLRAMDHCTDRFLRINSRIRRWEFHQDHPFPENLPESNDYVNMIKGLRSLKRGYLNEAIDHLSRANGCAYSKYLIAWIIFDSQVTYVSYSVAKTLLKESLDEGMQDRYNLSEFYNVPARTVFKRRMF